MELDGTTFSGHPTRTTFGNTVRVMLYIAYVAHRAGIKQIWKMKDFVFFVSGDDSIIKLKNNLVRAFSRSFRALYIMEWPQ